MRRVIENIAGIILAFAGIVSLFCEPDSVTLLILSKPLGGLSSASPTECSGDGKTKGRKMTRKRREDPSPDRMSKQNRNLLHRDFDEQRKRV